MTIFKKFEKMHGTRRQQLQDSSGEDEIEDDTGIVSKRKGCWYPIDIPGAELFPESVAEYLTGAQRNPENADQLRKHLCAMGWKIERKDERKDGRKRDTSRYRYTSHDGVYYYSLNTVCQHLLTTEVPTSEVHEEQVPLPRSLQETQCIGSNYSSIESAGKAEPLLTLIEEKVTRRKRSQRRREPVLDHSSNVVENQLIDGSCFVDSLGKMSVPLPGSTAEEQGVENNWSPLGGIKEALEQSSNMIREGRGVESNFSCVANMSNMSVPLADTIEEEETNGNTHAQCGNIGQKVEYSSNVVEEVQCIESNYSPLSSVKEMLMPSQGIVEDSQSTKNHCFPYSRLWASNRSSDVVEETQGIRSNSFPTVGNVTEIPIPLRGIAQEDQCSSLPGKNIQAARHSGSLVEEEQGIGSTSNLCYKKGRLRRSDDIFVEKEWCPQAVIDYGKLQSRKGNFKQNDSVDIKQLILKAKMHLSFEGWKFWYVFKVNKRELRYCSPKGNIFCSLVTACRAWLKDEIVAGRYDALSSSKILNDSQFSQVPYTEFQESSFGLVPSMEELHHQTNACSIGKGSLDELPVPSCNRAKSSPVNDSTDSLKKKDTKISCVLVNQGDVLDEMVDGRYHGLSVDNSQFSQGPYTEFQECYFGLEPSMEELLDQTDACSIGKGRLDELPVASSCNRAKSSPVNDSTDSQKAKNSKIACGHVNQGNVLDEMVDCRYHALSVSKNLDDSQFSQVPFTEFQDCFFGLEPSMEELLHQTNVCSIGNGSPDNLPVASSCNRTKCFSVDDSTDSQKQKNPKISFNQGNVLEESDSKLVLEQPVASSFNRMERSPKDVSTDSQKQKSPKKSHVLFNTGGVLDESDSNHVLKLSNRPTQRKTILSLLIDNGVVLPGQEVSYLNKRDLHPMAKGQITYEGIKCNCCGKVYGLSNFEVHAGSTNHRPAANIFLQDGRSLHECQLQIAGDRSDGVCSVCYDGGKLLLCVSCPSVFHTSCVGLENIPQGGWYCPSCRCVICGEGDCNEDNGHYTEKTVIYCDQCKREYHIGCLGERELAELKRCPKGNWFCSAKCSKIFACLQVLVGKIIPSGVEGLTWTILRSEKENERSVDTSAVDSRTEHHKKLLVARRVLHECFERITDPRSKRDIITDVVFCKESDLNQTDYSGFFTMLLERKHKVITVGTIRIFGEKVAELPLIGTSFKYRRQGMCRLFMNILETMLSCLGVERLLLPSSPFLLETWTGSFGFTKMTRSERLQFLQHTYLEFQGTTLCQKLLTTTKKT